MQPGIGMSWCSTFNLERLRSHLRPSSSNPGEWSVGVLEYCACSELHPADAGLTCFQGAGLIGHKLDDPFSII